MTAAARRRVLTGMLATAGVTLLPGCGSGGGGRAGSTAVTGPGTAISSTLPAGLDDTAVPDTATIHRWIERIVDQGVRRPGYAADTWTEGLVEREMRAAGLEAVRSEPVPVSRWEPRSARLDVTPAGGPTTSLACFPVPYAAPTEALALDLVGFDPADPSAAAGRAALVEARVVRVTGDALAGAGSAPEDRRGRVHDPDGTLAGSEHVLPHTVERRRILDPVIAAGAAAFVGALTDYPGGGHQYYVPYDGEARPIPGVWISGDDGAWLRHHLAAGPVRVVLTVDAATSTATSHNLVGELPGADEDLVIVGSHHDGPWASAVEDASGTALVLAQARFWAAQDPRDRPHRMIFVVQAGHMCGGAGLDAFLETHASDLGRTVLEVHLEHAALEATEHDGVLTATDRCTPRWFFTSRLPRLEAAVAEAIVAEDLSRSMLVAPDALGTNPPTDGGRFHLQGVPIVQFLAAPSYLFDPADTIDKVDTANLVPLTRAAIRILASTAGVSAAAMRAG